MPEITVKGHHLNVKPITNSFTRRAVQIKNKIIASLRTIGVSEDDIEIPLEVGIKRLPASVEFYFDGTRCYFSHSRQQKFIDNLLVVSLVIAGEVKELLDGEISPDDIKHHFAEDKDLDAHRKQARETLGVAEDCFDMNEITKTYKALSKKFHPDMPTGDLEMFQSLNHAHMILKRELA